MAKTIAQLTAELAAAKAELEAEKAANMELNNANATLKAALDAEVQAHEAFKSGADAVIASLSSELEALKSQPIAGTIEEIKSSNVATLQDGRVVEVHFGVNISELGKTYTREEILEDDEVIAYLLEIGSGAVSIVEADNKTEG